MAGVLKFLDQQKAKIYFLVFSALFCAVVWYATRTMNYALFGLPLVVIFAYFTLVDYKWLWYVMIALMPLSITYVDFFDKFGGVTFPTDFWRSSCWGCLYSRCCLSEVGRFPW